MDRPPPRPHPPPPPGPDGELRAAVERLERDLVVQRNRADVNSLFKEEHDRWAGQQRVGCGCVGGDGWRRPGGWVRAYVRGLLLPATAPSS